MPKFPKKSKNTKSSVKSNARIQRTTISKYFFCAENQSVSRKRTADLIENEDAQDSSVKACKSTVMESNSSSKEILSDATKNKLQKFSYDKCKRSSRKRKQFDSPIYKIDISNSTAENLSDMNSLCDYAAGSSQGKDEAIEEKMETEPGTSNKGIKYTPLEKQYFEFKKQYPDMILLVECGYKYRFFEDDAKIASEELNIACCKHHNLLSAIIPVHRLHIHVQRLVSKNYKVGVVKQTEYAALKAIGDNKNSLFSRKLHAIYTKSTLIGEVQSDVLQENIENVDASSGFLVCICEEQSSEARKASTNVAVLAIQPASGDIFYSSFQDTLHRPELESILLRINPSEIVYPVSGLSRETEHLLNFTYTQRSKQLRLERMKNEFFNYGFAINKVSSFYDSKSDVKEQGSTDILQNVLSLPPLVICCLSAMIVYLSDFKLEKILRHLENMKSLNELNEHMKLNAAAVRSLEIFGNAMNYSEHGSLFWVLNKTLTRFGERMLKLWISQPLKILKKIEERLDIITEIVCSESLIFNILEQVLSKLPDLEKMLCAAFYHRCSCSDFMFLINSLISLKKELHNISDKVDAEVTSPKLKALFSDTFTMLNDVENFSHVINEEAARKEDKTSFFMDTTMYDDVENCKNQIKCIEQELDKLKIDICKLLRLPAFKYSTVSGQKYLIEVQNSFLSLIPSNWMKISATKQVSRFRSPEVTQLHNELEQQQAILQQSCQVAWHSFLDEFGKHFYRYKKAISYLSELDCYLCFSKLAKDEHYCRPLILDDSTRELNIEQGRNPIVKKLMGEECQFVANGTKLNSLERCMIITGPNMGGKSTYIRQVALIVILAHIGCYVPAYSASIPLCDGVYIRIGADDDLDHNRSTFMSEMSETSDILSSATSKSLIILDELGRGTSTHDGSLVAYATLEYLISKIKCLVLFVTHYPQVVDLQCKFPDIIITTQMAFVIEDSDENVESVTFLYNLISGISEKSYGINVARLAQVPKHLLLRAQEKSLQFAQHLIEKRKMSFILERLSSLSKSHIVKKLYNLNIHSE